MKNFKNQNTLNFIFGAQLVMTELYISFQNFEMLSFLLSLGDHAGDWASIQVAGVAEQVWTLSLLTLRFQTSS